MKKPFMIPAVQHDTYLVFAPSIVETVFGKLENEIKYRIEYLI